MQPGNGLEPLASGSRDYSPQSLYYHPFAGHSESSFTSAVRPQEGRAEARPKFRRRGSESATIWERNNHVPWNEEEELPGNNSHVRSKTVDYAFASTASANGHPLAHNLRTSTSSSSQTSFYGTRPRLNRLLNSSEPSPSGSGSSSIFQSGRSSALSDRGGEKIVIVHEVAPKDSLAAVALKYGISLADLRRSNQMWISDSIHLRKILYIPLEKSNRAKEIMLMLSETDEAQSSPKSGSSSSTVMEHKFPEQDLTIRRIPASYLSFFPTNSDTFPEAGPSFLTLPRSYRSRQSSDRDVRETLPSGHSLSSTYTSHSTHTPSEGSHSASTPFRSHIASFFNSLPIAASTRDTIVSRLSHDSGASTPSQFSEEQDHELEDVSEGSRSSVHSRDRQTSRIIDRDNNRGQHEAVEMHPFNPTTSLAQSQPPVNHRLILSRPLTPHSGQVAKYLTTEPPLVRNEAVRTAQLEPSPVMQIPLRPRKMDANS